MKSPFTAGNLNLDEISTKTTKNLLKNVEKGNI